MPSHLKMLQNDVHTSDGKLIAPLLADHCIFESDVLVVQKP
jgi:hypothetical protein